MSTEGSSNFFELAFHYIQGIIRFSGANILESTILKLAAMVLLAPIFYKGANILESTMLILAAMVVLAPIFFKGEWRAICEKEFIKWFLCLLAFTCILGSGIIYGYVKDQYFAICFLTYAVTILFLAHPAVIGKHLKFGVYILPSTWILCQMLSLEGIDGWLAVIPFLAHTIASVVVLLGIPDSVKEIISAVLPGTIDVGQPQQESGLPEPPEDEQAKCK